MGYILCLATMALATAFDVEVRTLDGQVHTGTLSTLSEQNITLQTASGPVTLPTQQITEVVSKTAPSARAPASLWVQLVDGSQAAARDFTVQEGRVRLGLSNGQVECNRRDIAWVRLQPETKSLATGWNRLLEGKLDTDLLVLRIDEALDYHRGVIHDVTAETVQFELDHERVPVKRSRIYGLIFRSPEGRSLPASVCVLQDTAGSRWTVQKIALEGDSLRWTTPAGLSVAMPLRELARMDYSEGKIVFLSDLKPESVRWTPFFGTAENLPSLAEFFGPRQDRALEPRPIQLGGKKYTKGLALHSRTEMVYRLPRPFRRLVAVAGIDDHIRPVGHVQLIIRGDDKVLLDQAISGADPPRSIELDITGVRRLTILVDFGQDMDIGDHLLLGDIKLIQ